MITPEHIQLANVISAEWKRLYGVDGFTTDVAILEKRVRAIAEDRNCWVYNARVIEKERLELLAEKQGNVVTFGERIMMMRDWWNSTLEYLGMREKPAVKAKRGRKPLDPAVKAQRAQKAAATRKNKAMQAAAQRQQSAVGLAQQAQQPIDPGFYNKPVNPPQALINPVNGNWSENPNGGSTWIER